jgi:hypothetical protein
MLKRNLKVTKWLSTTPAVGVFSFCNAKFRVPMSSLSRTIDAQADLQEQFNWHVCKLDDAAKG